MTTLTGIKDAQYLAQFLGKKIAVRDANNPNKYYIFPELFAIYANKLAEVKASDGLTRIYSWNYLENPYVLLQSDVVVEMK